MPIEKHALLLGVSRFDTPTLVPLPKVRSDLASLAEALRSPDGAAFTRVEILDGNEERPLSSHSLRSAVERFLGTVPHKSVALVYLASHAAVDAQGTLLLMPSDYDPQLPLTTALPVSFLGSCLQKCAGSHVVFVLDTCYSDEGAWKLFQSQKLPFPVDMNNVPNFCVIASTRRDEPAIDGGFTPFLVDAIHRLDPVDGEQSVTLTRIFDAASQTMSARLLQIPRKWESVSFAIPIGRTFAGPGVSRRAVSELYESIAEKHLAAAPDPSVLDFIETSEDEVGFTDKLGIRVLEGNVSDAGLAETVKRIEELAIDRDVDKAIVLVTDTAERRIPASRSVRVLTFKQLRRSLHPVAAYLEQEIERYEDSAIHRNHWYISLKGRNEKLRNQFVLEEHIDAWLANDEDVNRLTVLGDFGTGKTTTAKRVFWAQARRHLERPHAERIPILITLKRYKDINDFQTLIQRTLVEVVKNSRISVEDVLDLNERGRILWILDGFDEMAVRVTPAIVQQNYEEILKLVTERSRVLLTCRTHFFGNLDEANDVFKGTELHARLAQTRYRIVLVEPYSHDDIETYVKKREGDKAPELLRSMFDSREIADLAKRPILLEMIVASLPKLPPSVTKNLPNLYKQYTTDLLKMEDWRNVILSPEQRVAFCKELAWHFFSTGRTDIRFSELPGFIRRYFPDETATFEEFEGLKTAVRTTLFLQCDEAGNFSFGHKSFMEYYAACHIFEQLIEQGTDVLEEKILPHEILRFLNDMIRDSEAAQQMIERLFLSQRFSTSAFLRRVLMPRLLPSLRLPERRRESVAKRVFHAASPFLIAAVLFVIIVVGAEINSIAKGAPWLLLSIVVGYSVTISALFLMYTYLTLRRKNGTPLARFNLRTIGHFYGRPITPEEMDGVIDPLDQRDKSTAVETFRTILGLPPEVEAQAEPVNTARSSFVVRDALPRPSLGIVVVGVLLLLLGGWYGWRLSKLYFKTLHVPLAAMASLMIPALLTGLWLTRQRVRGETERLFVRWSGAVAVLITSVALIVSWTWSTREETVNTSGTIVFSLSRTDDLVILLLTSAMFCLVFDGLLTMFPRLFARRGVRWPATIARMIASIVSIALWKLVHELTMHNAHEMWRASMWSTGWISVLFIDALVTLWPSLIISGAFIIFSRVLTTPRRSPAPALPPLAAALGSSPPPRVG